MGPGRAPGEKGSPISLTKEGVRSRAAEVAWGFPEAARQAAGGPGNAGGGVEPLEGVAESPDSHFQKVRGSDLRKVRQVVKESRRRKKCRKERSHPGKIKMKINRLLELRKVNLRERGETES